MGAMIGTVGSALRADPRYIGQPELVAALQNQYAADVEGAVKGLRDAKINPAEAFNPASKHYVGSKDFISGSISQGRQQLKATSGPILEVGTVKDGYRFKGGDPKMQQNWEKLSPTEAKKAAPAPAQPATATDTVSP
jgi:hypothetical protein